MAYNFSANQFERFYNPRRLGNWELPRWYPKFPRQRKGSTKVISNDRGHLLPDVPRTDTHPWGKFRSTYQLPKKITLQFGKDYDKCLNYREKWKQFPETLKKVNTCAKEQKPDFNYVPGDFTPPKQQHISRNLLLKDKYERENNIESELPLNKYYLGNHDCVKKNCKDYNETFSTPVPLTASLTKPLVSPEVRIERPLLSPDIKFENLDIGEAKMPIISQHSITEKPNERCPSPIVPAYANFEQAKRMHNDNLDHQPLPDCVADIAYRKRQITGPNPGLALDIEPIATGVGIKTYNAGPTHCTKMRVFRPKTCGVVPKAFNNTYRAIGSAEPNKKMGAMDLAICWDYRPDNPADEPLRSKHIDGSNDSAGPAVFTYVKSPREDAPLDTGRSAGVFNSTNGELGFFDKDIMRRQTDFTGRKIGVADTIGNCDDPPMPRNHISRQFVNDVGNMPNRYDKQYQSTPNMITDRELKSLREKYLGPQDDSCLAQAEPPCKRQSNFLQRARSRLCHKVGPEPSCCHAPDHPPILPAHCRAFRVGVPQYNAAGHRVKAASGCHFHHGHNHHTHNRVLVVPQPRIPYSKKNYNIETLVPPFTSFEGGARDGGYPEHWRLASVYQHAYKPMQQRKKPLIQTVYK